MVDLPPPEEPTRANFCPGFTLRFSPLSTWTSGLLGYANLHNTADSALGKPVTADRTFLKEA